MEIVKGLVVACVSTPIWLYLLYHILVRVEASELMWFLYWIYIPATILVAVMVVMVEQKRKL